MNGAPDIDSFGNLPEGFENWSLRDKEAHMSGEPISDSQGEGQSPDTSQQKLAEQDLLDIPGEKIVYPTIEPEEPKPPAETLTAHPETLASSLKREANEWYGNQTDLTKRMVFKAFTDIDNGGMVSEERKGELVRRSVGSIPQGAKVFADLTENPQTKEPARTTEETPPAFDQNRMPSRKGFDPSVTQVFPAVTIPEAPKPVGTVEMFRDPSVLIHTVKEGDSVWKVLENILEK